MHKSMDPKLTPNKITHWSIRCLYLLPKAISQKQPSLLTPHLVYPLPNKKRGCGKVSKFPVRSWAMVVMSTVLLVQYPWQMRMPVRWQPRPCPRRGVRESGVRPCLGFRRHKNGWVCLEVFVCWWMEELSPNLGKSCNSQVDGFESAVKDWRMSQRTRKI